MNGFVALTGEAIRDAFRRRIVFAIVVLSVLSLLLVDGCTNCAAGEVIVNDQAQSLAELAGAAGVNLFTWLGLWIIVLAGVLASDHLQQTLEDGSANLCLARPVSRDAFVLSRLAGALTVAWVAGAVLLGATAGLLHARSDLPIAPAVAAGASCAVGAAVIAALAMAASLVLPRLGALLLVFGVVASLGAANLSSTLQRGEEGGSGALYWLDQLGPPLASGMFRNLDPWISQVEIPGDPTWLAIRLGIWALLALALLLVGFRRIEIRG